MDIIAKFTAMTDSLPLTIAAFLAVLTVVVFIHELGHFLVARWCGVTVTAFSIGFGREIFGWNDRLGTRWKFCWIPLGGYVKFLDDEDAASARVNDETIAKLSDEELKGSFHNKGIWQRIAIVAAGPIANFILAFVIFSIMFSTVGQQLTSPRVDNVLENSAAERAGFQPGDVVVSIDGESIKSFNDMQRIVIVSADTELSIEVERDGSIVTLQAVPEFVEEKDRFGNVNRIGRLGISRSASPDSVVTEVYSLPTSMVLAVKEIWFVLSSTMSYLYDIIIGKQSADQLRGPIGIADITGQVATLGIIPIIQLTAFLSISIGLINLFPIPMLDGGHLLYYFVELVRGKPLSETTQEYGFRFGVAVLLMLMLFTTWNDITRYL